MKNHADVLIVGGGIIGLTTAYFLGREGLRVQVVEQGEFGREASWAGAGIIPPGNATAARSGFDRLRGQSSAMFPALSEELRQRTKIDNGYFRCGGLEFLAESETAAGEEWRGEGIACDVLEEAALQKVEPALASGLGKAFHLPDMAQLRNPRHLKAMLAGCQSYGVELIAGCPVHCLECQGSQIRGVQTALGLCVAKYYLLAAGAWTGALLQQLGYSVGIKPVRGQIALLQMGNPIFNKILLWGARYLVPRPDGRVLVGSTEEDVGFNRRTTAQAIQELLQLAIRLVPALTEANLERCWAGLRPGSPDGLPVIGPVPDFDNLFIAAGHFRAGIQLSPGTALVLKEMLLGQPLTIPVEAFSLKRFK